MGGVSNNYIPRSDPDFDAWATNFRSALSTLGPGLGIDAPTIGAITHKISDWHTAYAAHITAMAAADAALATKRDIRESLEQLIRPAVRRLQTGTDITDAARASFGITIPGAAAPASGTITTRPLVDITLPARLTHELRLRDADTPTRKALPRGVRGAEVWLALTPSASPAPSDQHAYRFIGMTTRPDLTQRFTTADGGKTAHYQCRWLGMDGARGPWAEIAAATIAA